MRTLIVISILACTLGCARRDDQSMYDQLGQPVAVNVANGSLWFKMFYTVQDADTVDSIATLHGTTTANLRAANPTSRFQPGDQIIVFVPDGLYKPAKLLRE